jgi:hypothetical protein
MENMPKNVVEQIFYFTKHPVAEIVQASGIFKCLEHTNSEFEEQSLDFVYGRYDGHSGFAYQATWKESGNGLYTAGYEHARFWGTVDPALSCRHKIKARIIFHQMVRR